MCLEADACFCIGTRIPCVCVCVCVCVVVCAYARCVCMRVCVFVYLYVSVRLFASNRDAGLVYEKMVKCVAVCCSGPYICRGKRIQKRCVPYLQPTATDCIRLQ